MWRRPPSDLDLLLSCRYSRVVARDHTVRVGDRRVQLPRTVAGRSYAGYRVEVRELLSGELVVLYHDAILATQQLPGPFTLKPRAAPSASRSPRPPAGPPPPPPAPPVPSQAPRSAPPTTTHPWRRTPFSRRERLRQQQAVLSSGG